MFSKAHPIPTPYGHIPKYRKKKVNTTVQAPYPFFSTSSTNSFFSFLSSLFTSKKEQVGFMPIHNNKPQIQTITSTEPIDCHHHFNQEDTPSLSTSMSSSESSTTSSNQYSLSDIDDNTSILSDILCDHYVYKQQLNNTIKDDNVPLETFRLFEAPLERENDRQQWILVEQSEKYREKKSVNEQTIRQHTRDIRTNTDYFRMIVAEVNMMRAQKIVCPLRQRRVLPKRNDPFKIRSSPLQNCIICT
ncbi:hypothetical protein CU097_006456 [Rhizopus azygosporus]|uniref:Uncharacterized protein n=1 Tax=Rhizopus azygosporus TaxID=86630 RepID=A0A367J0W5_RHIAZ|nr:hypothetical protein CU097_006456 [Rhizopus azygosporus]